MFSERPRHLLLPVERPSKHWFWSNPGAVQVPSQVCRCSVQIWHVLCFTQSLGTIQVPRWRPSKSVLDSSWSQGSFPAGPWMYLSTLLGLCSLSVGPLGRAVSHLLGHFSGSWEVVAAPRIATAQEQGLQGYNFCVAIHHSNWGGTNRPKPEFLQHCPKFPAWPTPQFLEKPHKIQKRSFCGMFRLVEIPPTLPKIPSIAHTTIP